MKNLKISQKLILSFVIVIVLAVAIGVVGIVGMLQLNTAQDSMYTNQTAPLTDMSTVVQYFQRIRVNVREFEVAAMLAEPENVEDTQSKITTYKAEVTKALDAYYPTIKTDEARKTFETARNIYDNTYKPFLDQLYTMALEDSHKTDSSGIDDMVAFINANGQAATDIADGFQKCMDLKVAAASEANDEGTALFNMLLTVIIAALVVAAVIAIVIALYISNLISKPIILMARLLKQTGETGNLSFSSEDLERVRREAQYKDEVAQSLAAFNLMINQFIYYGETVQTVANQDLTVEVNILGDKDTIGNSLKTMVASLNEIFGEINGATGQVSSGAKQIADGAQGLAQGSTQQAAAVEQLSSSISEIAQKTKENATEAGRAANLSEAVRRNAEKGSNQMGDMISAVREINDASQNIQKVIKVIDDIAFQTNILALNAAVEAARAGQHGKGFAVVAEEVRNLAAKSAAAASDTGALIANSMEKAELGAKIAEETAASLNEIVEGINESSKIVSDIASSSEEQSVAISQINNGIDQVAQVVQQNSATSEESAATAEELSGQSSVLEDLVAQFKLKGASASNRRALPKSGGAKKALAMPEKSSYGGGDFGKY
ncbi:methyl-accepting chemotaxis protein [Clostridia bacterium]|nr:methyl-accepting chemotaxis protein [Clostridia bacterium]